MTPFIENDPLFGKPRLQKLLGKQVRESTVEQYLVKRVKALGGEVRKVTWQGRRGAPDRLVMLPETAHASPNKDQTTVWVELKRPGAKPEPHQEREHERMRSLGQTVLVIDSKEAVDRWLP